MEILQLIVKVQSDSATRQQSLRQLVNAILRTRKIGRSRKGQSLSGVHQTLYEQVREQLFSNLEQTIDRYDPQRVSAPVWVAEVRDQAFRQILSDDLLKQLALEAQRCPVQTEQRRHLLGELVEAIQLSGKLARPHQSLFSPPFYALIYEEAVNRTLTYICRSIDRYDPERGEKKFMSWVNFRLDRNILDCRRELSDPNLQELPSLAELDSLPQPETIAPAALLRDYIETDPDRVFRQAHIKNRPDANFQFIALSRFVQDKSWAEISSELGIAVPTLSSFFQRRCQDFIPLFEQHLYS